MGLKSLRTTIIKYKKFWLMLIMVIFIGLMSQITFAVTTEFSADVKTSSFGTNETVKAFVKGNKIRFEISVGGVTQVEIIRPDRQIEWFFYLGPYSEYKYGESDYKQGFIQDLIQFSANSSSRIKNLGIENVNGYDCKVIEYTSKEAITLVGWVATELNFPVRYQLKNPNGKIMDIVDFTNIKTEPLDDSLFELPAGYTK